MVVFGILIILINAIRNNSRKKALAAIKLREDQTAGILLVPLSTGEVTDKTGKQIDQEDITDNEDRKSNV